MLPPSTPSYARALAAAVLLLAAVPLRPAQVRGAGAARQWRVGPAPVLVGIVLASGQALVWDAGARRYRLLGRGDSLRGAQVLDVGPDRLLVERAGVKHVWRLGAPLLLHPAAAAGRATRRAGVIVTPWAPRPRGARALHRTAAPPRRPASLPPAPLAGDEPLRRVRRRAVLSWDALSALAANLVRAAQEIRLARTGRGTVRVRWVRPGGVLAPLGLRAGDELLRLAGKPVDSVERAAEVFASLRRGGAVTLAFRRGRTEVLLRVVLR